MFVRIPLNNMMFRNFQSIKKTRQIVLNLGINHSLSIHKTILDVQNQRLDKIIIEFTLNVIFLIIILVIFKRGSIHSDDTDVYSTPREDFI